MCGKKRHVTCYHGLNFAKLILFRGMGDFNYLLYSVNKFLNSLIRVWMFGLAKRKMKIIFSIFPLDFGDNRKISRIMLFLFDLQPLISDIDTFIQIGTRQAPTTDRSFPSSKVHFRQGCKCNQKFKCDLDWKSLRLRRKHDGYITLAWNTD